VPLAGAVVRHDGSEPRGVGGQREPAVSDLSGLVAVDGFAAGWRSVPSLVDVAHERLAADKDVAGGAGVADGALELTSAVLVDEAPMGDVSRHSTLKESTNWWKFRVESSCKAVSPGRTDEQVARVAVVLNFRPNIEVL